MYLFLDLKVNGPSVPEVVQPPKPKNGIFSNTYNFVALVAMYWVMTRLIPLKHKMTPVFFCNVDNFYVHLLMSHRLLSLMSRWGMP